MRAWKMILLVLALSIGIPAAYVAAATYIQNVTLADIKVNGTGQNYFSGAYPVKYWNFNQGPVAGVVSHAVPSLGGTSNRALNIPIPPYNADAGAQIVVTQYEANLDFLVSPGPSPAPGATCTQEGTIASWSGGAGVKTTIMGCQAGTSGSKTWVRIW